MLLDPCWSTILEKNEISKIACLFEKIMKITDLDLDVTSQATITMGQPSRD